MTRSGDNNFRRRTRELRRAWRTFSWQVVRHGDNTLSRRVWLSIALAHVRCGVVTGGGHWWGPLREEYEGQRFRKRSCRLCKAKMTPASEFERNPFTPEEEEAMPKVRKPTEADAARAAQLLQDRGLMRGGKTLWD